MKNQFYIRGSDAFIILKFKEQTFETVIDVEDLKLLEEYNCTFRYMSGYCGTTHKGKTIYLHRIVKRGQEIDHHDGNKLNNRKGNLRDISHQKNMQNRSGATKSSFTGVRNVYWSKQKKQWVVQIAKNGKRIFHQLFHSFDEAVRCAEEQRAILFEVES